MKALPHCTRPALLALAAGLAVSAHTAMAQDATGSLPTPCAAAIAAELPEDSSPVGHTLNVDEAHAGLFIAAGAVWNALSASAKVPQSEVAFLCAEIALMQGTLDMTGVEVRFGRNAKVRQLAASQSSAAQAEQASMVEALRIHTP